MLPGTWYQCTGTGSTSSIYASAYNQYRCHDNNVKYVLLPGRTGYDYSTGTLVPVRFSRQGQQPAVVNARPCLEPYHVVPKANTKIDSNGYRLCYVA